MCDHLRHKSKQTRANCLHDFIELTSSVITGTIPSPVMQLEVAFEAKLSERASVSEWAYSACQQIRIPALSHHFHSSAASIVDQERKYLNVLVISYGITADPFEAFSLF